MFMFYIICALFHSFSLCHIWQQQSIILDVLQLKWMVKYFSLKENNMKKSKTWTTCQHSHTFKCTSYVLLYIYIMYSFSCFRPHVPPSMVHISSLLAAYTHIFDWECYLEFDYHRILFFILFFNYYDTNNILT